MKISIEEMEQDGWNVIVGDKYTGKLTFEEMIGIVAQLTVPDNRKALQWLRTREQWDDDERWRRRHLAGLTQGDDR